MAEVTGAQGPAEPAPAPAAELEAEDLPFTLPETYDVETLKKIREFFQKREKNPYGFTFTGDGNLEVKEGAVIRKRGKGQPAETILLKQFLPLDPSEREKLEGYRLETLAELEDAIEAAKTELRAAWEEYGTSGAKRPVLLANQKVAELDTQRARVLAAHRSIIRMDDLPVNKLLMNQPYETRKLARLIMGLKEPWEYDIYRMSYYPFRQEYELGKYVADELAPGDAAAAAAAAGEMIPSEEAAFRQKLADGRIARIFFESNEDVNGFLSPMFPVEFTLGEKKYFTGYQAYEVARAEELGNAEVAKQLLGTRSTRTMRLHTRNLKGHPADARGLWTKILTAIYQQHPPLKEKLLATGTDALVYADVREGPSGVGLAEKDRGVLDPSKWKGENVVGLVLETLRTQMREGTVEEAAGAAGPATGGGVITEEEQKSAKVGAIINTWRARGGAAGGGR
jgi:predicted NAD-dependent protein-ADP-ribosyltransferase YbiA (DUF1768 family)